MRIIPAIAAIAAIALAAPSPAAPAPQYKTIAISNAPFAMPPLKEWIAPPRQFNLPDYGARPDGSLSTRAFAAAVSAASSSGGGKVVVPPGEWTTGPVRLQSNVELHLSEGATLVFTDDPSHYLPAVPSSWEGVECLGYSPLVYAFNCENVAVTGKGVLAPKMDTWRKWFERDERCMKATETLYWWCTTNAPLASRNVPALEGSRMRPHLIQLNRCTNAVLKDFSIRESPFWTIHLFHSHNVVVRGVDVTAHGHNNDGIDIEMTSNVLVENCRFDQGDDGFVFKSGRNHDAWRLAKPTENVVCRNCTFKFAHSLVGIGSELSAGVRNVWVTRCSIGSVYNALYVKTNKRRGGFVENIWIDNIHAGRMRWSVFALATDVLYQWARFPTVEERRTRIRNIHVSDLSADCSDWAFKLHGDPLEPACGIHFKRIRVGSVRKGFSDVRHCRSVTFDQVELGDAPPTPWSVLGY